MRLLVANTAYRHAYSIIRALRPYARKITAALEGDNRLVAKGRYKVFDSHFRYHLQDPVVSFLWWLRFTRQVLTATKHLGS